MTRTGTGGGRGREVALGIRPHSGWAVLVAVTAPPDVELVHRDRIDILADGDPKQPWHAAQAAGLAPGDAAALAARVAAGAEAAAGTAIRAAVDAIESAGHRVVAAAVVGEPHDVPSPAQILQKHRLLHAAEGDLYFSALVEAATDLGLVSMAVPPSSAPVDPHADLLTRLGKEAGPPWRVDHRLAVVAALQSLPQVSGRTSSSTNDAGSRSPSDSRRRT